MYLNGTNLYSISKWLFVFLLYFCVHFQKNRKNKFIKICRIFCHMVKAWLVWWYLHIQMCFVWLYTNQQYLVIMYVNKCLFLRSTFKNVLCCVTYVHDYCCFHWPFFRLFVWLPIYCFMQQQTGNYYQIMKEISLKYHRDILKYFWIVTQMNKPS